LLGGFTGCYATGPMFGCTRRPICSGGRRLPLATKQSRTWSRWHHRCNWPKEGRDDTEPISRVGRVRRQDPRPSGLSLRRAEQGHRWWLEVGLLRQL